MESIEAKIAELTKIVCQLNRSGRVDALPIQMLNDKGLGSVSIKFIQTMCEQFIKVG
jgi:hypothetical protein